MEVNDGTVYLINKDIIIDLKLCITSYLILAIIVESERKYKTLISDCYYRYSEIKGFEIAKRLLINPSTVSYHLKKLRKKEYVIKSKFGYCISDYVEGLFNMQDGIDYFPLPMHRCLAKFCKTPEQVLVATHLWNEFYLKKQDINKTAISEYLAIDRKTIYNIICHFDEEQTLRIWKNKVIFLNEAKEIFSAVMSTIITNRGNLQ